ncbi:hypothetical protein QBC38DRAFT_482532 [Podospora fimiseda]|uniref:Uncharacterized protein n=1 Tax=Podospora fimiseda TaxID=252190 RepID=A0AAN7GV92_9PEZI|nr:hypothetical protein QBC38DRAFT_482532 [Podospora fimiseda]
MNRSIITTSSAPQLGPCRQRGPILRLRKYGQNDFERFDAERAGGTYLNVGSRSIGQVEIDVKYRWKEAQWGVVGSNKRPGGIVYMDLTFSQPHGYRLKSARVFVTLSEDSNTYMLKKSAPKRERASSRSRNLMNGNYGLQLTEHFGPHLLTGPKTVQKESKSTSFVPTVELGGIVGLGGVGQSKDISRDRESQWTFMGRIRKLESSRCYTTLEWELSENELDHSQPHKPDYQTGFAFEHNCRPVYMRVEIEGKLRGKGQRLAHKLRHNSFVDRCHPFSSNPNKENFSSLTCIDLSENKEFQMILDPIAKSLDEAMGLKNSSLNRGLEVPGPMQAQYFEEVPNQGHLPHPHQSQVSLANEQPEPPALQPGQASQPLQYTQNHQQPTLPEPQEASSPPWRTTHTEDDILIRALAAYRAARPNVTAHVNVQERQEPEDPTPNSDDTTVGSTTVVDSEQQPSSVGSEVDDPVAEIVKTYPAVRYFLEILVGLQKIQGKSEVESKTKREAPSITSPGDIKIGPELSGTGILIMILYGMVGLAAAYLIYLFASY